MMTWRYFLGKHRKGAGHTRPKAFSGEQSDPPHRISHKPKLLAVLFAATLAFAQNENSEPVEDFKFPHFNDAGFRDWHVRGKQGIYINDSTIKIIELNVRQFTGDGSGTVTSTLRTPEANFNIDTSLANGASRIEVKSEAYEVSGSDWIWQGKENRITINENVKVTIMAEIGDILK